EKKGSMCVGEDAGERERERFCSRCVLAGTVVRSGRQEAVQIAWGWQRGQGSKPRSSDRKLLAGFSGCKAGTSVQMQSPMRACTHTHTNTHTHAESCADVQAWDEQGSLSLFVCYHAQRRNPPSG
ncbi:hypothetical protein GOP47_0018294, partial [Adiantum capillus-veneris]